MPSRSILPQGKPEEQGRSAILSNRGAKPTGPQHKLFDLLVILKGLDGVLQLFGGSALIFVPTARITALIGLLTQRELSEDPQDVIANMLWHWATSFGHDKQVFAAVYLMLHGMAKVTLASLLIKEKNWAFPLAIAFFATFVGYSGFRLSLSWSWVLAGFMVLDLLTIWIVWREWRAKPHLTSTA
jgi:uncharacterized membrane protein